MYDSKSGDNFISVKLTEKYGENYKKYSLNFVDSFNFLSTSIEKLVDSLKKSNHNFDMFKEQMKKGGYSEELISMVQKKGIFPYEYITSEEVLEETSLPSRDRFYSSLKQTSVSEEDYKFALEVFEKGKCKNIKDYLELYLKTDVYLLAEIFENFRKTIFLNYSLDPAQLLTISSLAMQAALLQSKRKIELLRDISVITDFETSVRGGLTSVVQGKNTFNNEYLKDYDEKKDITTGIFLDVNSLYATVLSGKLPVGNFHELSEKEIKDLDLDKVDLNGNHCYALKVDFEIPDEFKKETDDLPMGINQEEIGID